MFISGSVDMREGTVRNCLLVTSFNDYFGDIGWIAAKDFLQMRGDAAPAIVASAKGRFVRILPIRTPRSEGRLF